MPEGKNFEKRLARLQTERDACDTTLLRELHQVAIEATHEAASVLLALENALADDSRRHESWASDVARSIERDTQELVADANELAARRRASPELEADPHFQLSKSVVAVRALSCEARIQTFALAEHSRARELEELTSAVEVLFDQILGREREQFSLDAVKSALGFAVGMVPIAGQVADAFTRIRELLQRHQLRAAAADAHVQYLTDYYAALRLWIKNAQRLAHGLQSSPYP